MESLATPWAMEFNGLPLHPLVVHVVVVFAPLAGIGGILYALVPTWRGRLRWPLMACAVLAAAAGIVAVQSGQDLETTRHLETLPELATHSSRGRFLRWVLLAFLVPTALATWQLGGPSPVAADGKAREGRTGPVAWSIQVLLVAGAVTVLVCVFLTGDSGSRSVWGQ
jgi:hypothetical protein